MVLRRLFVRLTRRRKKAMKLDTVVLLASTERRCSDGTCSPAVLLAKPDKAQQELKAVKQKNKALAHELLSTKRELGFWRTANTPRLSKRRRIVVVNSELNLGTSSMKGRQRRTRVEDKEVECDTYDDRTLVAQRELVTVTDDAESMRLRNESELIRENAALRQQLAIVSGNEEKLCSENAKLVHDNAELRVKLDELDNELYQTGLLLKHVNTYKQEVEAFAVAKEQELKEICREKERLESTIDEFSRLNNDITSDNEKLKKNVIALRRANDWLEERLTETTSKLESAFLSEERLAAELDRSYKAFRALVYPQGSQITTFETEDDDSEIDNGAEMDDDSQIDDDDSPPSTFAEAAQEPIGEEQRSQSPSPPFTCRICHGHRINTALKPCGHTLCERCASRMNKPPQCALCRQPVEDLQHIYL